MRVLVFCVPWVVLYCVIGKFPGHAHCFVMYSSFQFIALTKRELIALFYTVSFVGTVVCILIGEIG